MAVDEALAVAVLVTEGAAEGDLETDDVRETVSVTEGVWE